MCVLVHTCVCVFVCVCTFMLAKYVEGREKIWMAVVPQAQSNFGF